MSYLRLGIQGSKGTSEPVTHDLGPAKFFSIILQKPYASRFKINGYQLCKSFLCAARVSHHLKCLSFERASTTSHMDLQSAQSDTAFHTSKSSLAHIYL